MRWSVVVVAEGDREMTREEIVELADAVAASSGSAAGIGTASYGAELVVHAENRAAAVELATVEFVAAAARAGLPSWPIARAEALSEADDFDDVGEAG